MAATFVAGVSGLQPSSVQTPASTQVGDLVFVAMRSGTTAPGTPSGWTLLGSVSMGGSRLSLYCRIATSSGNSPVTWPYGSASQCSWSTVAYRTTIGVAASASNSATTTSHTAPTLSTTSTERVVSFWLPNPAGSGSVYTPDVASTLRYDPAATGRPVVYDKIGGPGLVTGTTLTVDYGREFIAFAVALQPVNVAPNAPAITSLTGGVSINRTIVNRASWTFSDPDAGDSQSKFDLRYRIVGAGSWTTITTVTPNQFHDFAASALAAGDYEWQVRTYDSLGAVGPYTSSAFFTADDPPTGPTITAPTNGATVDRFTTVTWSVPDQDEYQVRRVADAAGAPVPGTVYFDTGAIAAADTRSVELDFSVNNRAEHVQVRVKDAGLWSEWASIQVNVAYDPPPAPEFEIQPDPDLGRLLVVIGNPAPGAGEEPTVSNNVWVDDGDGFERRATGLDPNSTWIYWTPVSGRDYLTNLYVEAVAANGATTPS